MYLGIAPHDVKHVILQLLAVLNTNLNVSPRHASLIVYVTFFSAICVLSNSFYLLTDHTVTMCCHLHRIIIPTVCVTLCTYTQDCRHSGLLRSWLSQNQPLSPPPVVSSQLASVFVHNGPRACRHFQLNAHAPSEAIPQPDSALCNPVLNVGSTVE